MDSSISSKDEVWFLRVCHHISNAVYLPSHGIRLFLDCKHQTAERGLSFTSLQWVHRNSSTLIECHSRGWGGGARNMLHEYRSCLHAILLSWNRQRKSVRLICMRLLLAGLNSSSANSVQTGFVARSTSEFPVWWLWWYFYNTCNNLTCEHLRTGYSCKCPKVVECNKIDGRTVLSDKSSSALFFTYAYL